MIKIYYLSRENIPFYIGKTKTPLHLRLSNHRYNLKDKNIKIHILDEVNEYEWKFWESYWIEQFKQWGFDLKNKNNGGGGPLKYSPKSIQKLKDSWDLERRRKHSLALTGRKQSEETKRKKSKALKGKNFHTSKSKEKISQKLKGIKFSNDRNKKIREKNSIKILQFDLKNNFIQEFNSITEASQKTYISRSNISNSINNKLKQNYKFIWIKKPS